MLGFLILYASVHFVGLPYFLPSDFLYPIFFYIDENCPWSSPDELTLNNDTRLLRH
jgi:hypothetical protein